MPWRIRLEPFAGDIVLAGALTVAAVSAASGLPPAEPTHALLVVVVAVVTASLALRRIYPLAVLAFVTASTVFFAVAYDGYWPFAALLAIYSAAAHCRRNRSMIAGAAAIGALAVPIAAKIDWQPLQWSTVAHFAGSLAPLAAAWILGDNIRTRREYLRAVEGRAAQLEREQEANARRAAAEEQSRIAREVHDVVAHNLSVIIVQATGADAIFDADPTDARRAVRSIGATARRALDELRLVLGVVNDGERRSAALAPQPGLDGLGALLDQVRTAGVEVKLEVTGERRDLPSALELSAYRIVQEALTNTLRHSHGTHASVRLRYEPEAYLPFALNVLTFRETLISNVTAFIVRSTQATDPEAYERFPEQPFDPRPGSPVRSSASAYPTGWSRSMPSRGGARERAASVDASSDTGW